jgi:hypothetical protein
MHVSYLQGIMDQIKNHSKDFVLKIDIGADLDIKYIKDVFKHWEIS